MLPTTRFSDERLSLDLREQIKQSFSPELRFEKRRRKSEILDLNKVGEPRPDEKKDEEKKFSEMTLQEKLEEIKVAKSKRK